MKGGRTSIDYLHDIAEAAGKAIIFVEGMDLEEFRKSEKEIFAVIRALEIIGEASKNVSAATRAKYPDIPWRDIAGMRDKLAHAYFGVNLEFVWKTVRVSLPALRDRITEILDEIGLDGQKR
jgi:uncharacterized protein with HEPN domain